MSALLVGELYALLLLEKKAFSAGLKEAEAEAAASGRTIQGSMMAAGKMVAVGLALAVASVIAIGVEGLMAAVKFQQAMKLIQTQAGASAAEVDYLSKAVLNMAASVGTAPDKLAAGLYHIESAGIRGALALDVLKTAALGAKLGNADLEAVTNALIAEVNSGIPGIMSMGEAMGVLNGIVGNGNMRMQDLVLSMSTGILSVAKTFGVTMQSLGAAIATMTDQGVPAVDAATKIKTALISLASPIGATKKAFSEIGLNTRDLADEMRSPRGLVGALSMLKEHMDAAGLDSVEQGQLIAQAFGKRGGPAVMTLVNSLGLVAIKEQNIKAAGKDFGTEVAAMMDNVAFKADQLGASLQVIAIQIGDVVLPAFSQLLDMVNSVIGSAAGQDAFGKLFEGIATGMSILVTASVTVRDALAAIWKTLGDLGMQGPLIIAVVGAIAVAFGAWAISMAALAVGTIITFAPLLLALLAVALAVRAVQMAFDYFGIHIEDVMKTAFGIIGGIVKGFIGLLLETTGAIVSMFEILPGPLGDAAKAAHATLDSMRADVDAWGNDMGAAGANAAMQFGKGLATGSDDWQNDLGTRLQRTLSAANSGLVGTVGAGPLAALGLTPEQMKSLGLTLTDGMVQGVQDGTGNIIDATKTLVENFGTSLKGVGQAAKISGGDAMAQMAKGILDARNAPLDAFGTLKNMMKNAMLPAQEELRLAGELMSKELAKGLKSKDPAIRAQAIATKKLIIDRLDELVADGEPLGKKAMKLLAQGLKSKDPEIHAAAVLAQQAALRPLQLLAAKALAAGKAAGVSFTNGFAQEVVTFGSTLSVRISRSKAGGPVLGGTYASGAWKIPNDQLAFIHKGEMVVPAAAAERLRNSSPPPDMQKIGGNGANGAPVIGNMYLTINPGSDVSVAAAQRFGQNVLDAVAGGLREQRARTA